MVEIIAPAGNWSNLEAALPYANAVYFGIKGANMREGAENFTIEDLKEIVEKCHAKNVLAYLATNIVVYDEDLETIEKIISEAKKAGIDAIIVSDFSVIQLCKKYGINFHISVQMNVANLESAKYFSDMGAEKIVLSRELNLEQISRITKELPGKIECFVHGALCVSVSGRCFFSQYLFNKGANKGKCLQPCRRECEIKIRDTDKKIIYNGKEFIGSKDLCMIEHVDRLVKSGISAFKIEGRMKDGSYVETTARTYKEAVEAVENSDFTKEKIESWRKQLENVFNKGFCTGFYFGVPKDVSNIENSISGNVRKKIGIVINYFKNPSVALIKLEQDGLEIGEEIIIDGKGFLKQKVESMEIEKEQIKKAKKGEFVGIKVSKPVKHNEDVYKIVKRE